MLIIHFSKTTMAVQELKKTFNIVLFKCYYFIININYTHNLFSSESHGEYGKYSANTISVYSTAVSKCTFKKKQTNACRRPVDCFTI